MAGFPNIEKARLPRAPQHGSTDLQRDQDERDRAYSLVRVRFPFENVAGPQRKRTSDFLLHPGDTLQLVCLDGSDILAVSTGKGRDFIPMHEGDELTRRFEYFRVRLLGPTRALTTPLSPVTADALFLVSTGKTLHRQFKPSGFAGGFPIGQGTATTAGVDVLEEMVRTWGVATPLTTPSAGLPLIGKFGGAMLFKNLDTSLPIYLYNGASGSFNAGSGGAHPGTVAAWRVDAGETVSLEAMSRLSKSVSGNEPLGTVNTLCCATTSGTAVFNLMLSRWGPDVTDLEAHATYDVGDATLRA